MSRRLIRNRSLRSCQWSAGQRRPPRRERTTSYPVRFLLGSRRAWGLTGRDVVVASTRSQSRVGLTEIMSMQDLIFEAEIQRIEGNGLVLLSLGTQEYVMNFGFVGSDNRMRIVLNYWRRGVFQKSPADKPIDPVDANKWNHLRIEKKGSTVVCFFNHKEVFRETNDRFAHADLCLEARDGARDSEISRRQEPAAWCCWRGSRIFRRWKSRR